MLYDQADFDEYRRVLTQTDWDAVFSTDDIDKCILNDAEATIPNEFVTIRKQDHTWLTNDTRKLIRKKNMVIVVVFNATFNTISSIYHDMVEVSFIGGGNRSTWRKPPTYRKSLTNFITYCCIEYISPMSRIRTHNFSGDRN